MAFIKICPIGARVLVHAGRLPSVPGTVSGYAIFQQPGEHEMVVACVVDMDKRFDSPEGLYVRHIVVPIGGFDPA